MRNLQIGDKEYPAIQYKDGWLWIDKNSTDKKWANYSHGMFEVIAQSPELNLEGVPVVDYDGGIGKPLEDYIRDKSTTEMCVGFIDGYKAAQSKGCYSEEQVRKAFKAGSAYIALNGGVKLPLNEEQFLQSIQPKIVVEVTCVHDGNKDACGNETCWDLKECQKSPSKPVTFIKDGRTYFKLKEA